MKTIRCAFVDFWEGFVPRDIPGLFEYYDIILDSQTPDYVFYSCFGYEHYKYQHCVKLFWCGENAEPDFNECDYAISYSELQYGDRAFHHHYYETNSPLPTSSPEALLDRGFCNFVYSNNSCADPFRIRFFEKLSTYKKIDSAGAVRNNVGYTVPDGAEAKIKYLHRYKFTLAIENSSKPGYATEKISHPFLAHSLPIYWGDPHVTSHYNAESFVNLMAFSSMDEMVDEIIRLDQDDEAYLRKITAPFWAYGESLEQWKEIDIASLFNFLDSIFSQPKEKAIRRTMYGWVRHTVGYRQEVMTPLAERIIRVASRRVSGLITSFLHRK